MWIINNRKFFYALSGVLLGFSIISVAMWGIKFGVDFTGGSVLEVEYNAGVRPEKSAVEAVVADQKIDLGDYSIRETGDMGFTLRSKTIESSQKDVIVEALSSLGAVQEKKFNTIGPTLGNELKNKALFSFIVVVVLITLFIAYVFRHVSKPVSSWKYGLVAIATLVHDLLIPIGVFSALGHLGGVEVDTLFIVAILVILGYSINDTIIVFDRIRENLLKVEDKDRNAQFETVVGESLQQTIARSTNTSFTTLISLIAIYFLGGDATKYFALALIFGIAAGTYSSIFFASPMLVSLKKLQDKKKEA
jgi:preprotein translocase subunit SecF